MNLLCSTVVERRWWQRIVQLLFLYICIEGLVTLLFYEWKITLIFKDIIVLLAYATFGARVLVDRTEVEMPKAINLALFGFGVVGLVQLLNPALENVLVGLVGIKTRLFYIPLLYLGFHYFHSKRDLIDFGFLIALPTVPLSLFAAYQYLIGPDAVAKWGEGFARSIWLIGEFDGSPVYRPASTFTAVGLFGSYLLITTLLTTAFGNFELTRFRRVIVSVCLVFQLIGVMVNAQRFTILFLLIGLPGLLALYGLQGSLTKQEGSRKWRIVAANAAFVFAGLALGWNIAPTATYRAESMIRPSAPGQLNLRDTFIISVNRLDWIAGQGLLGHGLGSASPGARYVVANPNLFVERPYEGLFGQLIWEMGLIGLAFFLVAWLVLLAKGVIGYIKIRDSEVQSVMAAIILYNLFLLATAGTYALVAYSPANVYFWFLAGMMIKLPSLNGIGEERSRPQIR